MKHNIKKILLPLALLVVVPTVAGCSAITNFINNITGGGTSQKTMNEIGWDESTDAIRNYYNKNDVLYKKGANLINQLHAHMWTTHTNQVTYSSFKSMCYASNQPDSIEHIPGTSYNETFYSGKKVTGYPGSMNREHVWAAANSAGLWDHKTLQESSRNGGSDLYHIRMADQHMNTARGNAKFVDFDDFPAQKSSAISVAYDGGKPMLLFGGDGIVGSYYQYAQRVEVDDSMKGDVARILAYTWLHYTNRSTTPAKEEKKTSSGLQFKNILGYSDEKTCQRKILEWSRLDPPSEVEKHRNDTVQAIQGNRNPFVDFPNLLAYCFNIQ